MTFANRYPDLPTVGEVVAEQDFMARDGVGRRVVASVQAVVQSQPTPGTAVPVRLAFSATDTTGTLVPVTYPLVLAQSAVAVSGAADTNENTLATITVPANSMGLNGRIVVTTVWSCTNNANAKTPRVRWGGASGTIIAGLALASNASGRFQMEIMNRNSASTQLLSPTSSGGAFSASTGTLSTASVDTTAATTIVITGQKATGSDTLTLESYHVELFYGA